MQNLLEEKAVLMKFSAGMPGKHRKDKTLTDKVTAQEGLDPDVGKWIKELWPPNCLKAISEKQTEARTYHDTVTFPFGVAPTEENGEEAKGPKALCGMLPAVLIPEYGEKMRIFKSQMDRLVDDWLKNPQVYIDWAQSKHNGTFEPSNYPGCDRDDNGVVTLDVDKFREVMRKKFYMWSQPLPVPNAAHFTETVSALLGLDAESVDLRVTDAAQEAQRELMRRLIEPVKAMATKLSEDPKNGRDDIVFRDSLVGNVQDIVRLAPALNLAGDPAIDAMVCEVEKLTHYGADQLRKSTSTRAHVAESAAQVLKRLEGYKI
jgi:hypothetical protein